MTIKGINDYATAGGISGGEDQNKDYLDDKTRYLYYHFYMGDLVGYDFSGTTGRAESADKLQKAIWMLEGEMTMNESNQFVALANSLVGDSWRTGLESVKVLNLYNADGSKSQDQLTMVPEPGTLLSLGIVLLGLGGVTRRKFKR